MGNLNNFKVQNYRIFTEKGVKNFFFIRKFRFCHKKTLFNMSESDLLLDQSSFFKKAKT